MGRDRTYFGWSRKRIRPGHWIDVAHGLDPADGLDVAHGLGLARR
ncbi:hypothetical protein [Halovivax gelatinilyticus]|nr:hypothetical protein [Halovivax gelatinilyticus]